MVGFAFRALFTFRRLTLLCGHFDRRPGGMTRLRQSFIECGFIERELLPAIGLHHGQAEIRKNNRR